MKKVLFVAYGSGHIKMVVPLAQALAANGMAKPVVLALRPAWKCSSSGTSSPKPMARHWRWGCK